MRSADVERRASFGRKCLWRLEVIAYDTLYWWPFKLLGPDRAARFGGWLMGKIGPRISKHKIVRNNLALAFPDMPKDAREQIAKAAWVSLGRTAGELPHLPAIRPYESDRVEIVGVEHIDAIAAAETGAVLVSGHFANWEIMAAVVCNRAGHDCVITYRAINNPHIDKRISAIRHAYGIGALTPKGIGTREVMRALSAGKSVGLMNDQKFREGIAVKFIGVEAMTAPGPTRMAMKYNVPLVYIETIRTAPARFKVIIHPPYSPAQTGDKDADVKTSVEWITARVEDTIRANPDQWFWQHQRWPKTAKPNPKT